MPLSQLTQQDYQQGWGKENLIKLPADAALVATMPAEVSRFLVEIGLPRRVLFIDANYPQLIDLSPLEKGMLKISDEYLALYQGDVKGLQDFPFPDEWSPYLIFGEQEGMNTGDWICLNKYNGQIVNIDPGQEVEEAVTLLNSSISQLAETLLRFYQWSKQENTRLSATFSKLESDWKNFSTAELKQNLFGCGHYQFLEQCSRQANANFEKLYSELADLLRSIDAAAFQNNGFWSQVVDLAAFELERTPFIGLLCL